MEYYRQQHIQGLEGYFHQIEQWLKDKPARDTDNKPLLLSIQDEVMVKTLLVKWIEYRSHLKTSQAFPDVVISHFASTGGNNSNYFYTIYRILIKLRETFNIKQKVELVEEKIRRNFSYWLDLCQQRMENSVVYDGQVIIIIEGINNFVEFDTKLESEIKFWLPKYFPKRIRIIVTSEPSNKNFKYLAKKGCQIIEIHPQTEFISDAINELNQKNYIMPKRYVDNFLEFLQKKAETDQLDRTSTKAIAATFCPYETKGILTKSQVSLDKVEAILSPLDLPSL